MDKEILRQSVHLSGLAFVFLALFIDRLFVSAYFLMMALSLLIYSIYVRNERRTIARFISDIESRFRKAISKFERDEVRIPYMGAFWFYLSCGAVILFFPANIALASCAMLAFGDSLSTIIGTRLGKHRIFGRKSVEGSVTFFAASFFISLFFVGPVLSFLGAVVATFSEILPDTEYFRKYKERELINDNLTIPVITGIAMILFTFVAAVWFRYYILHRPFIQLNPASVIF
jgi:dolichol kinase